MTSTQPHNLDPTDIVQLALQLLGNFSLRDGCTYKKGVLLLNLQWRKTPDESRVIPSLLWLGDKEHYVSEVFWSEDALFVTVRYLALPGARRLWLARCADEPST